MTVIEQNQRIKINRWGVLLLVFSSILSLSLVFYAKPLLSKKQLELELPALTKKKREHIAPLPNYLPFQIIPHIVTANETLNSLAKRYETSEETLKLLNNNTSSFIRSGEKLLLPNQPGVIHIVSSGESLLQISYRYNTPLARILDVNELSTATVQPNSLLFIPQQLSKPLRQEENFSPPLQYNDSSALSELANNYVFERTATAIVIPTLYHKTVYATTSGTIAQLSYHPRLGRYILLKQKNFFVLYAYLTAIEVEKGQKITAKQPLAKIGKQFEQKDSALLYFSLIRGGRAIVSGNYPETLQEILATLGATASKNAPPLNASWQELLF